MPNKTLDDRRRSLEESFFKKKNESILESMREKRERHELAEALGRAMPVHDDSLLEKLVDAGIRAETWLAISLIPLVEVAWADRDMSDEERAAILEAAAEDGITADSDGRRLLESWLTRRPGSRLREAWKGYIEAVVLSLGGTEREILRDEILERAGRVAKATGGLLGLGSKISAAEQDVIDDLSKAF